MLIDIPNFIYSNVFVFSIRYNSTRVAVKQSQTLPPMSTFRGTSVSTHPGGPNAPHSPVLYNQQLAAAHHPHPNHPHSQHSPAIQNDTIVGKAMQTMFTSTDQSISSFSSNPSTPVNSPPPNTSQSQQQAPTPTAANSFHPPNNSNSTFQQLNPVINGGASSTVINGFQNGNYPPELVARGLHLVSSVHASISACIECFYFYFLFLFDKFV